MEVVSSIYSLKKKNSLMVDSTFLQATREHMRVKQKKGKYFTKASLGLFKIPDL